VSLAFCSEPGCAGIAKTGKWCENHQKDNYERRRNAARPEFDKFYNRAAWAVVRGYKLRHAPMCEFEGCSLPATDVHHVNDEWKEKGEWREFINQQNLQSLCHAHHSKITIARNRERGLV